MTRKSDTMELDAPPEPPILRLPVEIFVAILSMLDDLPSLLSAILAARAFNNAFLERKMTILSRVLVKRVGVDIIFDALAAIKAEAAAKTRVFPFTSEGIQAFCAEHFRIGRPVPPFNDLGKATAVARLSATVKAFTARFAQWVAAASPEGMSTLTATERARVERAFYLFETFCSLFRSRHRRSAESVGRFYFFSTFCPWELEQLGCIHDFLFHQVQPGKCIPPTPLKKYCCEYFLI
jgi:hypothetical protein